MSREIASKQDVLNPASPADAPSDFKDRLVKLIPSEIVTAYITLQGMITANGNNQVLFIGIAIMSLLALTPFYLSKISKVNKVGQIIFTTLAFLVWVMASGGFHILFPSSQVFENDFLGSMILLIYTLFIPLVYKG